MNHRTPTNKTRLFWPEQRVPMKNCRKLHCYLKNVNVPMELWVTLNFIVSGRIPRKFKSVPMKNCRKSQKQKPYIETKKSKIFL